MSVADCLKRISDGIKGINESNMLDEGAAGAAKVQALYKLSTEPSFLRRFDSYIRNAYLTALPTHINNNIDNLVRVSLQIPLTPIRAAIDKNVELADTTRMATGWAKGFMKAAPRFWNNLSETLRVGGLGIGDIDVKQTWHSSKVADNLWLNRIATLPTALSRAFDDGAKAVLESMANEMSLARLIDNDKVKKFAAKNNIGTDEVEKELRKYLAGDTSKFDLLDRFSDIAKYKAEAKLYSDMNTLNSPLGNSRLDKVAKKVEGFREAIPGSSIWLPFIKVPYLATKEAVTYIPGVGELRSLQAKKDLQKTVEALADTKTKLLDAKRKLGVFEKTAQTTEDPALHALQQGQARSRVEKLQQQLTQLEGAKDFYEKLPSRFRAQQIVGAGMAMAVYNTAYNGYITGHFEEPGLRERMKAAGIPPMSVKIGDRWVSYEKLEPFSTVMGMVADFAEHEKSMLKEGKALLSPESVAKIPRIVVDNILNKTFTEPLSQMLQALQDPDRYGNFFINSLGAVVPAGVAQVAKIQDPTERVTKGENALETARNVVQARIPETGTGLPSRRELPANIDLLGQAKSTGTTTENILGKNIVSAGVETLGGTPAQQQTMTQRLLENPYLTVSGMKASVNGIEINQKQLEQLRSESGVLANKFLTAMVEYGAFQDMPRPMQAKIINGVFESTRNIARKQALGTILGDDKLRQQFLDNIMKRAGARPETAPVERQ